MLPIKLTAAKNNAHFHSHLEVNACTTVPKEKLEDSLLGKWLLSSWCKLTLLGSDCCDYLPLEWLTKQEQSH